MELYKIHKFCCGRVKYVYARFIYNPLLNHKRIFSQGSHRREWVPGKPSFNDILKFYLFGLKVDHTSKLNVIQFQL